MKIKKINSYLFFWLGVLCTFAALQINIGMNLAIYNYVIILIILFNAFFGKRKLVVTNTPFLWLILVYIFSLLLNMYMLEGAWLSEAVKFIFKAVILLILLIVVGNEKLQVYFPVFVKGLYVSAIIQVIWEYIELVYWYAFKKSFNAFIFGDILGIQASNNWITYHGAFRPMGLSWESANLSMVLIFGFVLSKNKWLKSLFFISVFLGGSRTGIIGMIVAFFCTITLRIRDTSFRISRKSLLSVVAGIICLVVMSVLLFPNLNSVLFTNLSFSLINSISRMSQFINGGEISAGRHLAYILNLPEIFSSFSFHHLVIGFGTQAAGLPYTLLYGWESTLSQWSPESDFVNILVGNGIVGAGCYYYLLVYNYKRNKAEKIKILMIVLAICGLMNIYIRTWTMLVAVLLSAVKIDSILLT